VIIGDSLIAGSGLTQEEILSEVLEARLGVSVYPYAPVRIDTFLKDPWFRDHPPDIIVLGVSERFIEDLRATKHSFPGRSEQTKAEGLRDRWKKAMERNRRARGRGPRPPYKRNMLNTFAPVSGGSSWRGDWSKSVPSQHGPIFLGAAYEEKTPGRGDPPLKRSRVTMNCSETADRFIFLPIPEKEYVL
jgi:hypothetical protein